MLTAQAQNKGRSVILIQVRASRLRTLRGETNIIEAEIRQCLRLMMCERARLVSKIYLKLTEYARELEDVPRV